MSLQIAIKLKWHLWSFINESIKFFFFETHINHNPIAYELTLAFV